MSKIVFGQSETVIDQVPTPVEGVTVETTTTVAPGPAGPSAPNGAPPGVPARVQPSGGLVLGDFLPEFKDISLPRINLVQGVGQLKDSFPQGAIVYAGATVLYTPAKVNIQTGNVESAATSPINITLLGVRPTRFSEKIEGGGQGMLLDTEDEVRTNGGTLDYKEWELKSKSGMKRFEPLVDGLFTIQRPAHLADDDTIFVYECEGEKYALAMWGMKGSAYTHAMKRVFNTARLTGCLRGGFPTHSYSLSTRLEKHRTKPTTYQVPVVIPRAKNSPEFLKFVASILHAPESQD